MTAIDDVVDLESAIDDLYRGALDTFTTARNDLAATLRKAGRRAEADRVKALTRPTASAWAVNQVWWRVAPVFHAFLDAGAAERAAHRAFASGRVADVRSAASQRERAVAAAVDAAAGALGRGGSADARFRIAGTIEALASGGVPAGLVPGRFTRDLQSTGLEALGGSGAAASSAPNPSPRPSLVRAPSAVPSQASTNADTKRAARRRAERMAEAEARLASVDAALQLASRDVRSTTTALEEAQAAHAAVVAHTEDLERQLAGARDAVATARRALGEATKAASEAELRHARTAREMAGVRQEMADLRAADEPRTP